MTSLQGDLIVGSVFAVIGGLCFYKAKRADERAMTLAALRYEKIGNIIVFAGTHYYFS
jgi:hypothetical protein